MKLSDPFFVPKLIGFLTVASPVSILIDIRFIVVTIILVALTIISIFCIRDILYVKYISYVELKAKLSQADDKIRLREEQLKDLRNHHDKLIENIGQNSSLAINNDTPYASILQEMSNTERMIIKVKEEKLELLGAIKTIEDNKDVYKTIEKYYIYRRPRDV